jgi:hypothetical protein
MVQFKEREGPEGLFLVISSAAHRRQAKSLTNMPSDKSMVPTEMAGRHWVDGKG